MPPTKSTPRTAALTIRRVPVGRINPAPYNPRRDLKPGDPEYEKLARSLDEFGCVEPLVWNRRTGNLVGGHQRFKVLLARGAADVEVSVVSLSPERERALNLALNRISGDWDQGRLAALLEELAQVPDFDLGLTGFDPPEVDALLAGAHAAAAGADGAAGQDGFDVDAELAAERPVVTRPGDLILLGRDGRTQHRLLCGDATDPGQVRRLMDGQRAVLFATDPPYLVNYTAAAAGGRRPARGGRGRAAGPRDAHEDWDDPRRQRELYGRFIAAAVAEAIRPDAAWYCWHASRNQSMLEAAWAEAGALVHQQVIWAKGRGVLTRSWYLWQHEPCFMGWLKGRRPRPRGGGGGRVAGAKEPMLSTVWCVEGVHHGPERPDHPTPKPVELFAVPIRQHTRPGEVLYEPFAGSGTQIVAAQGLGRRCFAMEISPRYCDLIVRRFIALAGEGAVEEKVARRYRAGAGPRGRRAAG